MQVKIFSPFFEPCPCILLRSHRIQISTYKQIILEVMIKNTLHTFFKCNITSLLFMNMSISLCLKNYKMLHAFFHKQPFYKQQQADIRFKTITTSGRKSFYRQPLYMDYPTPFLTSTVSTHSKSSQLGVHYK